MGLFKLVNNAIQLDPDNLAIPQMRAIWDKDTSKDKAEAIKSLQIIFYMADFKSPYMIHPVSMRLQAITEDFLKQTSYELSDEEKVAIKAYNDFQETPSLKLLKAARAGIDKIAQFLISEDPNHKNYSSSLEKLGKMIESLDKTEAKVKAEQSAEQKIRGGGDVSERER